MKLVQPETQQPSWIQWLMPRPFDWVSSFLYIGTFGVHLYFRIFKICDDCTVTRWGPLYLGLLLGALLVLDRIEYWRYGEAPRREVAQRFLVVRICLIIVVSLLDSFNFSMFLYVFIPFTAFPIVGRATTYGLSAFAWIIYLVRISIQYPIWSTNRYEVIFFTVYTFGLIFMVAMAHVVDRERRSRERAEALLQELEVSHQQLRAYTNRVAELATTEERNRLARDIHDSLGHYLTVINVQLEKALAFRKRSPEESAESVLNAKHLASEALQDIRHSVGALREGDAGLLLSRNAPISCRHRAVRFPRSESNYLGERRGLFETDAYYSLPCGARGANQCAKTCKC